MIKSPLIITLLLAVLTSAILAQDCNNPLLGLYGFSSLDAPQSGADLPYCTSLQNAETCCSADTVATFQDILNDLIEKLNNYAAAKDLYITQLRNDYLERFNDILEDIRDNYQDELLAIRKVNAAIADQLKADIDTSTQLSIDAGNINNQFVGALDQYQKDRSHCLTAALQLHFTSWCEACDPNWAAHGVGADGNVVFSDGLCQVISDTCTPFFVQGARFNPLIRARAAYWRLSAVSRYLRNFAINEVVDDFVVPEDPYDPLDSQQEVIIPDPTTNTGPCQNLWARNEQLRELLTVGATVPQVENNDASRLLQDSLAGDAGVWAPDITLTGLDFERLRYDPGDLFGVSDYSDYLNQTQDALDLTDNDVTDDDLFDKSE